MAQGELKKMQLVFKAAMPYFKRRQDVFVNFVFHAGHYYELKVSGSGGEEGFVKYMQSIVDEIPSNICTYILKDQKNKKTGEFVARRYFSELFAQSTPVHLKNLGQAYAAVLEELQDPDGAKKAYEGITRNESNFVDYYQLCGALGEALVERLQTINNDQVRSTTAAVYTQEETEVIDAALAGTDPFQAEADIYRAYTSCYCENNLERFAVERYLADAEENVFACMWLGDIFYHGLTVKYGNINRFDIPVDYKQALYYYMRAARKTYIPAMWAAADMHIKGKDFSFLSEERVTDFLEKGERTGYPPALNTLGSRCLKQALKQNSVELFEKSAKYFNEAAQKGFIYAFNQLFFLLTKPEYQSLREQAEQRGGLNLFKGTSGKAYLEHAVKFNNGWAMNRYALRYCTDDSGRAKELFRKAAEYGEPWGAFNYADKFCKNDNLDEYRLYMNQASKMGLAAATIALAEYLLEHPEQENGDISAEILCRTAVTQIKNDPNQDNKDVNSRLLYLQSVLEPQTGKRVGVRK